MREGGRKGRSKMTRERQEIAAFIKGCPYKEDPLIYLPFH